jgi:HNH endonuclease
MLERQANRVDDKPMKKKKLRVFLRMFTTSAMGLGLGPGVGHRPTTEQSNFRSDLIKVYDAKNNTLADQLWCPVTGDWRDASTATASHIFSWKHGKDTMAALFGKASKDEMFSPRNGLILANQVEALFDRGFFVIVPDIADETQASIEKWNKQSPKEYKLRLLNRQHPMAAVHVVQDKRETWLDCDGRKLKFRNDFRPRARYLYFHYCCQMLRYAWSTDQNKPTTDKPTPLRHELRKQFWGTPGRYLPRNMLMTLVDEMGHQYDDLMNGAMNWSRGPEEDDMLLGVLTKQILTSNVEDDEDDDDYDSSDEDEEETDGDDNEEEEEWERDD